MPAFLIAAARYWKAGLFGLLVLLLAVQTVRVGMANNRADRIRVNLNEARAERDSLIVAAKKAKRLNDEQVARIEAEQQKVTDDVEANLNARLERLRSELRSKAAQGSAGRPQAGTDGKAAPGTPDPAQVCISSDQFLLGAEYEEKLDQWVTWYEGLAKIQR